MSAFSSSSSENNEAKRQKKEDAKSSSSRVLPSSLFFSFQNQEGNNNGIPSVDLSVATTSKQLELLINSLLANTDSLPYAFYINNVEVISSLQETLQQLAESNEHISYEETVAVTYQPLSVFRVRPVTRCVETMPGHTDAVLIVSYRYTMLLFLPLYSPSSVSIPFSPFFHNPLKTLLQSTLFHRSHVVRMAPDWLLVVGTKQYVSGIPSLTCLNTLVLVIVIMYYVQHGHPMVRIHAMNTHRPPDTITSLLHSHKHIITTTLTHLPCILYGMVTP